jgi:diadenosine tetraphosphate (Ap4A) HIT family hydrolase
MDCIFCKIANGEFDSAKIWEDENFIAILDLNPNTKGMALVMPKKHFDSDAFLMSDDDYKNLLMAVKKVSEILRRGLYVNRVAMVAEGMGVNHVHIKLYPLHGIEKEFQEIWAKEKVFFENYSGYISTQLGPKADMEDLKKLAEEIKNNGLAN